MQDDRFTGFSEHEQALLFEVLLFCIEANSGIGFRGYCQNRIEYESGAHGAPITLTEDSASTNTMFQFFKELSLHLSDSAEYKLFNRKCGIIDWQKFCQKAVEAAQHPRKAYIPLNEREGYYGPG
jgi:hypothetical protein